MLKRKNYWLLFALLLLSLTSLSPSLDLSTGNGTSSQSNPEDPMLPPLSGDKGERGVLRVAVSLNNLEFKELKEISSQYSLFNGITVDLVNMSSDDAKNNLTRDLTIGDSPDIIMTDGRDVLGLAQQGYLLPVDVYQSEPGSTPLTGLISQLQWNGYDWGVPLDVDPYVFVYSPQKLTELGFSKLPRTVTEWSLLLQHIRETKGISLLAMDTREPYGYSAVLESMGSSLSASDMSPLQWTEIARSYFFLTSRYNRELWDMLQDGTLAVAVLPFSEWQAHGNSTLTAEAPILTNNGKVLEAISSRCFALSSQSLMPEEAVDWLSFVTSSTSQLSWLESTGRLPALDEVYRSGFTNRIQLPFDPDILLTDDTIQNSGAEMNWSKVSEAVASFLTGGLDAAGYTKALQNGVDTGSESGAQKEPDPGPASESDSQ
ncbi:ABC transporter substrate-binding protein [Paenibacillus sp. sgz500958]|uniref:ABC transporter substrate-binding protein n=1 Tax=Paenibacillus sp. sgz500958 TaxID=3242475 RepID=UPI0036D3D2F1